jgi:iron complex outermembrane receptor protein
MSHSRYEHFGARRAITTAFVLTHFSIGTAHADKALEEVIVTAQKKDETAQTVPMTVDAVTSEAIEKYRLLDFKDIAAVTPGVTIKTAGSSNATIAMRGVNVLTSSAFGVGVAIYWNEITYSIDSANRAMYDIGQIEILRGPQGTLRGVTAPAGAVTFRTATPNYYQVDGSVEQSFSDNDLQNTKAAISLPIVEDKLALRVAGLYDHSNGDDTENANTGENSRTLTKSGRITLGFRPIDELEANLIYQYLDADVTGAPAVRGCGTAFQHGCFDTFDRKSVAQGPDDSQDRREITALKIDWNLGAYDFAWITGYEDVYANNIHDVADTGNAVFLPNERTAISVMSNGHNFTQEVRLSTADAEFWNWTLGAYYARNRTNTDVVQPLITLPASISSVPIAVAANTEDTGLFTNHSFQLDEQWSAQIGARYQSHRQTTLLAIQLAPGIDLIGADNAEINEAITGSASLSYQLNPDMMLYTSYGRSFRGGGFTIAPQTPAPLLGYDPETSDSLELGFKSRLADGRIQLNGDIYYQKYHDFLGRTPEGIRTSGGPTGPGNDFLNFNANAVVTGAELQLNALLTDAWQAGFGLSYSDGKYKDGETPCNVRDASGVVQDPTGGEHMNTCPAHGRLAGEPNWGVSATSEYSIPLGGFDGFARALYNFNSGRANDFIANSANDTSSYGIFNIYLGVRDTKAWEVSVWAKNLFDKKAAIDISGQQAFVDGDAAHTTILSGYETVQTIPRRELGITGKYNF